MRRAFIFFIPTLLLSLDIQISDSPLFFAVVLLRAD